MMSQLRRLSSGLGEEVKALGTVRVITQCSHSVADIAEMFAILFPCGRKNGLSASIPKKESTMRSSMERSWLQLFSSSFVMVSPAPYPIA